MESLRLAVQGLALIYWNETGEPMDTFPRSIVDFVVEYAINRCHFPTNFTESNKVSVMEKYKTSLAMACVDVFAKAGAEGERTHSENGISRTYSNAYIDNKLLADLPNYVSVYK